MDLCILDNKQVKTRVYDAERGLITVDSIIWERWMREHKAECEVARAVVGDVTIKTYYRGNDPIGAGYEYWTQTTNRDGYGAHE